MAIVTRLSRLIRADLHAVMDRLEEPEALLRQAVREMESALDGERRRLKLIGSERERLQAQAEQLERARAALEGEIDLCFDAGNESLARGLLRRRIEAQKSAALVERRAAALERERDPLATRIDEHAARLEAMREKLALFGGDGEEPAGDEFADGAGCAVSAAEVEVAFLREQRKRSAS